MPTEKPLSEDEIRLMMCDEDFEDDGRYDEQDDYEDAIDDCGQIPGEGCMLAGTEYCDFECPFRQEL